MSNVFLQCKMLGTEVPPKRGKGLHPERAKKLKVQVGCCVRPGNHNAVEQDQEWMLKSGDHLAHPGERARSPGSVKLLK
jgi:hypothetical protein